MTTDPDCIFCRIVAQEIPSVRVYEDANTLAFMDINPVAVGHTLVIPKQHWPNLFEMPDAQLGGSIIDRAKGSGRCTESSEPGWCESRSSEWQRCCTIGTALSYTHYPQNTG